MVQLIGRRCGKTTSQVQQITKCLSKNKGCSISVFGINRKRAEDLSKRIQKNSEMFVDYEPIEWKGKILGYAFNEVGL